MFKGLMKAMLSKGWVRKCLAVCLSMAMMLTLFAGFPLQAKAATFAGDGTESSPYEIQTAADLAQLSTLVNGGTAPYADAGVVYKLMNNIDLSAYASGEGWVPISIFYGTFDGNGKTISGLKINRPGTDDQGLFGIIDSSGIVKNLGVVRCDIIGLNSVGGLAGLNEGTLQNCYTTGIVSGVGEHPDYTGGLVGGNQLTGTIQNCYSISTVNGYNCVGGIAGMNYPSVGYIRNCYHIGAVRGAGGYVGGVIGYDRVSRAACETKDCVALEFAVDNGGAVVGGGEDISELGNCSWAGIKGVRLSTPDLTGTVLTTADECVSAVQRIGFSAFSLNDLPQYMKGEYFPGAGTEEDPYRISTVDDLANLSLYINYGGMDYSGKYFKLMNDIDLIDYPYMNNAWAPIGTTTQFKGIFDGNGKIVKNLKINCLSSDYQGLFGQIGSGGIVKNLGVVDASVAGQNNVGGLAAVNAGTVQACHYTGTVKGHKFTGGIAGKNAGAIQGCYSEGTVLSYEISLPLGDEYTGGIAGCNDAGTIIDCHSAAEVSGSYVSSYIGGVAGAVLNSGQVENCYFTGTVSGTSELGGVVGRLNEGTITDCHSTGAVSGNSDSGGVGGVVGGIWSGQVEKCYSTGPVSGDYSALGGVAGGIWRGAINWEGTIKACYSTSTVSSRDSEYGNSIGGIVGEACDCAIVENNIALGENVSGVAPVGRIFGGIEVMGSGGGSFSGNYAWSGMLVNGSAVTGGTPTDLNGGDLADWITIKAKLAEIGFMGVTRPTYIPLGADATAPTITSDDHTAFTVGSAGTFTATTTGTPAASISVTGVLPSGVTLTDNGDGTATIAGTPGAGTEGSYPITITATNGVGADAVQSFTLTVKKTGTTYFEGSGTADDPYLIQSAADLAQLSTLVNGGTAPFSDAGVVYKLMNNIDLSAYASGEGWRPISIFNGTFDGNGKTISGLKINRPGVERQGLFGLIYLGTVKNLGVVNCDIIGKNEVGGLVAWNDGTVQNCYTTGIVSGATTIGGLVGYNTGTIQYCYSISTVSGNNLVGGIAGGNISSDGFLRNCYHIGAVRATSGYGGGVIGSDGVNLIACVTKDCVALDFAVDNGGAVVGSGDMSGFGNCSWEGIKGLRLRTPDLTGTVLTTADECVSAVQNIGFSSFSLNDLPQYMKGEYFPGAGTEEDPYQISTLDDLANLSLYINYGGMDYSGKYFKLMNDIDLINYPYMNNAWAPIGTTTQFKGIFDGNGKVVKNLKINCLSSDYQGLFGQIGSGGIVKNLGVVDASVTGQNYVGGLAAVNAGTVQTCHYTGTVKGHTYTGGIAGKNAGTIQGCYSEGTVLSYEILSHVNRDEYTGGIAGRNDAGTIIDCHSAAEVSGGYASSYIGGVAGGVLYSGQVENCYFTGPVSGEYNIGGIVGYLNEGSVTDCHSTGSVSGYSQSTGIGGVVGSIDLGQVEKCYSTGPVSGDRQCIGGVAGIIEQGTLKSCYSTSTVSSEDAIRGKNIGGIVGEAYDCAIVQNNFALGENVAGVVPVGRIFGFLVSAGGEPFSGNYAWSGMQVNGSTVAGTPTDLNGGDLADWITIKAKLAEIGFMGVTRPTYIPLGADATAPTITSDDHTAFTVGSAGTFTVTTTGTPAASISVTGVLPSGVTLTDIGDGTAAISGTPGAGTNGTYNLTITAANEVSPDAIQSFTLTVNAADKVLLSITTPTAVTGVANGTAKTAAALGLPTAVTLVTDGGSVQATVTWDVAESSYDEASKAAQTFTVSGTVALPAGVVNTNGVSLTTSISVTVDAAPVTDKVLQSITAPSAVTGVANGAAKTAAALGLPTAVTLVTDGGSVQATVTWDVDGSSYDAASKAAQTFTVSGTVSLPAGVVNTNGVFLTTSISVTVDAAPVTDKVLLSITPPSAVTGVANGAAKTAAALGLPTAVTLVTDGGSVQATVTWDVAGSSYDPASTSAQTFTVNGTVSLPAGVVNTNSVSLTTAISVTVDAAPVTDKVLLSITPPSAVTGVANGTAKTAAALGLPTTVTLVTDGGSVQATVTWDVAGSSYDASSTAAQTFTVSGTVSLPAGVVNTNSVSLTTAISVTVDAAPVTDKVLLSITPPTAVTGVANGTAKTAAALGLPTAVTLVTDGGSVQATVTWDVAGSSYNPASTSAQTFTVSGTVALPAGVVNTNSVSLTTTISVAVDAAPVIDKVLLSITPPSAVTGVANGAAKTAAALGLPTAVTLVTDGGSVQATVTWDVAGSSYDPASTAAQTFTVSGTAALPAGVVNTNGVSLATSISVTVDAAPVVDKVLLSITPPSAVTGVANGAAKTAAALGLPTAVTMVTDSGSVQAGITWDVALSSYDASSKAAQTFTVSGTVALPAGVVNTNGVSLTTSISVTVDAASVVDKVLQSITPPSAVTGVANGAAKTAAALGLPTTVTLVTDGGSVQATVTWDVAGSSYNPASTSAQTFTANGTVSLPAGVVNTNSVSLTTAISVTVDAAPVTDKVLLSITPPSAVTGVANGAAKTAAALGLPTAVTLVTDGGSVQASVTWDVAGSSYDPASTSAQTFTVNGTVSLPAGVVNTNGVSLTTSISVTVDAAPVTPPAPPAPPAPPSAPEPPKVTTTTTSTDNGTVTTASVEVTGTTTGGTTAATVTGTTMTALISDAANAESSGGSSVIAITVSTGSGATSAAVTIPGSSFDSMASGTNAALQISTGIGSVTFDSTAVDSIGGTAAGDVRISMTIVSASSLPADVQQTVGDRPVYNFSVTSNGQTISSFGGGSATVSVPYTLLPGENPNAVVVYYIDASGNLQPMQGHYDAATGTVTFVTSHFSDYMIGYNKVAFKDVTEMAWYSDAVTFIAARGITTGTSEGVFSPDAKLTRGQFIVMLMRAYGISPDTNPADNFSDAGNTYYTGFLATAKRMGISAGIGNNQFAPDNEITRQEMFTLLYNTLKAIDQLPPAAGSAKKLSNFADAGQIADWAKDAVLYLVNAGAVGGSGGKLNPNATTTRAEMAQVLYNLLSK